MATAKLSIDLEVRLATMQQSLDKAGALAEGQAKRIEGAFANVGKGINTALGAIGGAYLTKQLVSFTLAQKDAILAIKDLSEATGASIENVSALEDVARRAGGGFDDFSGTLVKFNAALKDSSKTKELGAAFKALGLDVEELKRADPAEALRRVAVAMAGFADDGNKARLTQELFGKSVQQAAPFLRELAEQTELVGSVTKEQVEQVDRMNKAIATLQISSQDAARTLVGELAVAINELLGVLKGDGPGAINSMLVVPLQAVTVLGANVAFVLKGIGTELGGIAAQAAAVARLDFKGAVTIGEMMREDAKAAREEFDKLEKRLMQMGTISQASYSNEGRNYARALPSLPNAMTEAKTDNGKKAAADRLKLAEFAAQQLVDIEEQAAKDTAEAWDYWQKQQIANHKLTADAAKTQWQQVFDFIDAEQEREIQAGQDYLDAINASTQDAKKAGEEIGLVFASAAGQALTQWQGVRKLFQGVLADLAQIAVKKSVTEPLSGLLGNALGGFNWTSLFAGRASGGPVSAGTPYMVGESGPELFLPRSSGTIVPNGAVGGVTVHQVVNIGSGVSRNEVMAAMQATKQQTIAAIVDARTRGYALGPA